MTITFSLHHISQSKDVKCGVTGLEGEYCHVGITTHTQTLKVGGGGYIILYVSVGLGVDVRGGGAGGVIVISTYLPQYH